MALLWTVPVSLNTTGCADCDPCSNISHCWGTYGGAGGLCRPDGCCWFPDDYDNAIGCYDNDSYTDSSGQYCDAYMNDPTRCGRYDHSSFDSSADCCACGGGNWYGL